jgi:hypothetical protein
VNPHEAEQELRRYLQGRDTLFPPAIHEVIADVNTFISAILLNGFQAALTQIQTDVEPRADRPFVEVCHEIIEHHLRFVKGPEREVTGKSLFEAYTHFAGPEHAFESASKTNLRRSLQRLGARGFSASFLSLYIFNVVSLEIQDDAGARKSDLKSFELYMLTIEATGRAVVMRAMKIPEGKLDARWAAAVCSYIEAELLCPGRTPK